MATTGTNIHPDTNKCASLRLLQKKRELREVQELLEAERVAFVRKREELNRIESELHEKHSDLLRSKEKASQHLLQNDLKRTRAEERCAKEKQLCQELDSDFARLNEQEAEIETRRRDRNVLICKI